MSSLSRFSFFSSIGRKGFGLAILLGLFACDSAKFGANATAGLFERAGPAVAEYWDYQLVGDSMPASIVQLEGFLRIVPDNEVVLEATVAAYIGYGFGWIGDRVEIADAEDDYEEAEHLRRRQAVMYDRAWDLTKHWLRLEADGFDVAWAGGADTMEVWLRENFEEKEDAAVLHWAGSALGARISGHMDDFDAIADLPMVKLILQRSAELDPDYLYGSAVMTLAVLFASELPPDMEQSKQLFDQVLERTERRNLMAQVNMARHYAVALGDSELFSELLTEVIEAGDVLPENRLSNTMARRRAQRYLGQIELFFSDFVAQ